MQKRTREILALAMLVVLVLGVVAAMSWYIIAGHNWNKAASNIDDWVGSMDGYVIVVYDSPARKAPAGVGKGKAPSASSTSGTASPDAASGAAPSAAAAPSGEAARQSASPSAGSTASARLSGKALTTAREAAAAYREKGAATVVVDVSDPSRYDDPVIVSKHGRRIAIANMAGRSKASALKRFCVSMERAAVDAVIGITSDRAAPVRAYEGVDLLVYAFDGNLPDSGTYHEGTLRVDLSAAGKVQAAVFAPSGVLTAKDVQDAG